MLKINKNFAEAIIISKAPEWVPNGKLIPTQHIVSLHYQNRRPTQLSYPLLFSDICGEPIIKQIKHWRARIICKDFEAFPRNMGHLIAADSCHQIFCGKKLNHLPTISITEDIKLLEDHKDFSWWPVNKNISSFAVSESKAASMCLHSLKQPARSLLSRKRVFRGISV